MEGQCSLDPTFSILNQINLKLSESHLRVESYLRIVRVMADFGRIVRFKSEEMLQYVMIGTQWETHVEVKKSCLN